MANRPKGALAQFIADDRTFNNDISGGYAQAWALSHYLTETNPRGYAKYLQLTGAARNTAPNSTDRLKDFTTCFGANLPVLEANFLRYIAEIR